MGRNWLKYVARSGAPSLLTLLACGADRPVVPTDSGAEDAGVIARVCDLSREFDCNDGTCLEPARWCDGTADCSNSRDEADCDASCESGQVICTSGDCIALGEVCDGTPHCSDGSDELNCEQALCEGLPTTFPGYQGARAFTRAQWSQCEMFCGENDDCYNDTNCPGYSSFDACMHQEQLACSATPAGDCRIDYESFACCQAESAQQACQPERAVLDACLGKDFDCAVSAADLCFAGP